MFSSLNFKKLFFISTSLMAFSLTSSSFLRASGKEKPYTLEEMKDCIRRRIPLDLNRRVDANTQIDPRIVEAVKLAMPFLDGTHTYTTYRSDTIKGDVKRVLGHLKNEFTFQNLEEMSSLIPGLLVHHIRHPIQELTSEDFKTSLLTFLQSYHKEPCALNDEPRRMLLSLVCAVSSKDDNLREEGFKIATSVIPQKRSFSDWMAYFSLLPYLGETAVQSLAEESLLYENHRHAKFTKNKINVLSDVTTLFILQFAGVGAQLLMKDNPDIYSFWCALRLMYANERDLPTDKLKEQKEIKETCVRNFRICAIKKENLITSTEMCEEAKLIWDKSIENFTSIESKFRNYINNFHSFPSNSLELRRELKQSYEALKRQVLGMLPDWTIAETMKQLQEVHQLHGQFMKTYHTLLKLFSFKPSDSEGPPPAPDAFSSSSSPSSTTTAESKEAARLQLLKKDVKGRKTKVLTSEQKERKNKKKKDRLKRRKEKERAAALAEKTSSSSDREESSVLFPGLKKVDWDLFQTIFEGGKIHNFTMDDLTHMLRTLGCTVENVSGENAVMVSFEIHPGRIEKVKLHKPHGRSEADALFPDLIDQFARPFLERIEATPDTVCEEERGGASRSPASRSPTNRSPRSAPQKEEESS